MNAASNDNDDFLIIDDEDQTPTIEQEAWQLLVVDDDREVHAATRLALARTMVLGRSIHLTHAYSAKEAIEIFATRQDFAIILLDVVMETDNAGLELVSEIRETYGMTECRIILRTGQPGHAPEVAVFNDYDINDYCTKSELTRTRLITAIMAALRSYQQIRTIAENRRGLELIVRAVPGLMEHRAIASFGSGVLTQIAALLKIPVDGIICALKGSPLAEEDPDGLYVVGASGKFSNYVTQPLQSINAPTIANAITQALTSKTNYFGEHSTVLLLKGSKHEAAIYLETCSSISENDQQLVEVFAANIAACFANVRFVEKLNFVAYHDALTNLSNRSKFILQLESAALSTENNHVVALIDIDHFTDINNGLGQEIGNGLLAAVAYRLHHELSQTCQLARIANDVYGVLGPADSVNPANLLAIFEPPFAVDEHLLPVTVTLGLSTVCKKTNGYNLLKHASIALNQAKKDSTTNIAFFEGEMEEDTRWRLEVVSHLRQDFNAERLEVWYQPQISLTTGKVSGIEALLRWPSDIGFVQPPTVFIPLAEYSGLIIEIGEWVLKQSIDAYKSLQHLSNCPHHVSVNVSMPQFKSGKLSDKIASILGERRVPPSALELEITESIAIEQPRLVIQNLNELRELGVRVAIDDFGTGYSSLSQLKNLPIDCLKIDQSFIAEISSGKGGMFAETIVALGKKMGLATIAEGVETAEQAGFLRGLGCTEAQGYYYALPMPLPELVKWLEQQKQ